MNPIVNQEYFRQLAEAVWQSILPGEMLSFERVLSVYKQVTYLLHLLYAAGLIEEKVPEPQGVDGIWEDFRNNGYNDMAYDRSSPPLVMHENGWDQPPPISCHNTSEDEMSFDAMEMQFYCEFCYRHCEETSVYHGHRCKDERGFVCCPVLQAVVCPYCKATGRMAHTLKYCPYKPIITPDFWEAMELKQYEEMNKQSGTTEAYCRYCHNYGHTCKDERGLVRCPMMQTLVCSYCNATGLKAHKVRYCPNIPSTFESQNLQPANEEYTNKEIAPYYGMEMYVLKQAVRAYAPIESQFQM